MNVPLRTLTPRERLIFALDVDDLDTAERFVRLLVPYVGTFKVGPILYTSVGPMVIDLINGSGASCFLDLKFHDIPMTVGGAAREVARRRVKMFTVHALGGAKMMERAAAELLRLTIVPGVPRPMCLGVTILTSHEEATLKEIGLQGPIAEAGLRLAKLAIAGGAAGIVASAKDLPRLVPALPPNTVFVTPGIRGVGDPPGDQARVATAKEAIKAGATHLVVGRPIRDASDPAKVAQLLLEEIASA